MVAAIQPEFFLLERVQKRFQLVHRDVLSLLVGCHNSGFLSLMGFS